MSQNDLHIIVQPQEFFREQVSQAQSQLNINFDEEIEFYIVNLLCEFVFKPSLPFDDSKDCLSTPLALILKKALESPPEKQSEIFRKMGNTSLYISGFFQDYFNRKAFDITYYTTMGQTAFDNLSELMKTQYSDSHFSEIYAEISERFMDLVELVAVISDKPMSGPSSDNLLAIYDRWNQTKSERLRKILEENGISAVPITRKAQ